MIEIKGKYNSAICYCDNIDEATRAQIKQVCDIKEFCDSTIRIMPDVHAGIGCTIGTTMTITDKVVPGMVGVDIGCGMQVARIGNKKIDLKALDDIIHKYIPSGKNVLDKPSCLSEEFEFDNLRCLSWVNVERAKKSIGTLGGGNHFIEVDKDDEENLYIVIHSGSRHMGNEVAMYYQKKGYEELLRENGKVDESLGKNFAYVKGALFEDYINDMRVTQHFARLNRKAMMDCIVSKMKVDVKEEFTTVHNYIDLDSMILRKGSVSAKKGEKLLIPINMRDGSLICIGKGNRNWNYSAPHGAGRIMSRKKAREKLSVEKYKSEMKGIFTSCVNKKTLDESPMAYKNIDDIINNIKQSAEIIKRIKPIYNFKANG